MNYVITIARTYGSGGRIIAAKLSERLGIPYYERAILQMASEESGLSESLFRQVDERLRGSAITKWLSRRPPTVELSPTERGFTSDDNLFAIQADIIRNLAKTESCIVLGKCADVVLSDYSNVLTTFLVSSEDESVAPIMRELQVSAAKAREAIRKTNRYRSDYYHHYSGGKEWLDARNYDLMLNSARMGRDTCVDVLESVARMRFSLA